MDNFRVLLADDHAVVRAGIRNAIEGLPSITVQGEAEDGPTLMRALRELDPDILLIDVTMPDFEPIGAIRQIRAEYPEMKILVISAYDDDVYVQGLLGAGVDGYHLKDQPLQDLSLALERIMNGEKWISSSLVDKLVNYSHNLSTVPSLTSRQRAILKLLKKGWNNQKIALELSLSTKTIENHLTRIYRMLNVQSRLEAANYLTQNPQILSVTGKDAAESTELDYSSAKRGKILLVDDNPRFRHQLRRMIGNLFSSVTIYEAESVEESIELVKSQTFELVFIDVILGDQNGIFCAERVKNISPKSRVILISAYPDKEFHRQGLEAGAAAFIDKKMLDSVTIQQIVEDVIGTA
ncbi:MAG: response regulator transcription factor [Anaerolineaceae bacterium]|nr:response regulator transcription factor [Anaerolineaceae bacterium]